MCCISQPLPKPSPILVCKATVDTNQTPASEASTQGAVEKPKAVPGGSVRRSIILLASGLCFNASCECLINHDLSACFLFRCFYSYGESQGQAEADAGKSDARHSYSPSYHIIPLILTSYLLNGMLQTTLKGRLVEGEKKRKQELATLKELTRSV